MIHGTDDSIVPFEMGQRLFELLPGQKAFHAVQAGDHNDPLPRHPNEYLAAVDAFLERARQPR